MEAKQQARYNAYSLALSYLKENETITKDVAAFTATYEMAKTKLDAIAANENLRQQKSRGASLQKEQLKENLANQALAVAAIIGSYATDQQDANLRESVNFNASDLQYASGPVLASRSANIVKLARESAGALKGYGITDELLASLAKLAEQFASDIQAPRNDKTERKNAGDEIRELIKELDSIFINKLDAMMLLYRFTHRSFYNGYLIKRDIQLPGHRKTRLEGLTLEKGTGEALENVELSIDETDLTIQTGADGSFDLKVPLLVGAVARFKKAGYKTVEKAFTLQRGQATRLEVEMEKE